MPSPPAAAAEDPPPPMDPVGAASGSQDPPSPSSKPSPTITATPLNTNPNPPFEPSPSSSGAPSAPEVIPKHSHDPQVPPFLDAASVRGSSGVTLACETPPPAFDAAEAESLTSLGTSGKTPSLGKKKDLAIEDTDDAATTLEGRLAAIGPQEDVESGVGATEFGAGKRFWEKGRLKFYRIEEVPRYLQDNPFIKTMYRSGYTYRENWISLCHGHNESGNVWSHLLATVLFIILAVVFAAGAPPLWTSNLGGDGVTGRRLELAWEDRAILCFYLLASAYTYWVSTLFHLHLSHSAQAYLHFGCWDYSGISAGVLANAITILFYLHRCSPSNLFGWLAAILVVNLVGVVGPTFRLWPTAAFRPYRALVYIASATVSMSPIIHFAVAGNNTGSGALHAQFAFKGFFVALAMYFVGVAVYVMRLPERLAPGRFDLLLHSHQIWHVLCVAASLVHLYVIFSLIKWRHELAACI
ncbi:Progestin and adipoQ receptor member 3 [Phlyctochytrium bullatum]|nr:Progestin and adipoQ receptor member 3 [Phlyctochytrium bullatum]